MSNWPFQKPFRSCAAEKKPSNRKYTDTKNFTGKITNNHDVKKRILYEWFVIIGL